MPYDDFNFEGQAKTERILYCSRRHWMHFVFLFVRNNIVAAFGSGAMAAACYFLLQNLADFDKQLVTRLLVVFVLLIMFATTLLTWTIWYLTVTIITSRRLVKSVQKGIFSHYAHDLKLMAIQDVTYKYSHPVQYLFNYGQILVRAASGEEGKFKLNHIPNPRDLHHYLSKVIGLLEKNPDPTSEELPVFMDKGWKGKRKWEKEVKKSAGADDLV
ncbi:MAG: PH domain-containing protein [Candidatus Gracilibacteria bacterium]|nr:PH domain-containing protein [Candidatus Gracilibacteria bacterium]